MSVKSCANVDSNQGASFDRLILNPGAFRIFLAGMVLLSHLSAIGVGRLGVAAFFMLSGYWITNLWNRIGGYDRVAMFFANRIFRIYPLYIIVVLFCIALFHVYLTPSTFLLLGVATSDGPHAIGVEWSLDIEMQFYLVFPILYFLLKTIPRSGYSVCGALTVLGWLIGMRWGVETVLKYLPMFCIGMTLYIRTIRFSNRSALLSFAAFLSLFVACYTFPYSRPLVITGGAPGPIEQDVFAMIWASLLTPYLGASVVRKSNHLDRILGDSSYPMYLIHYPVIRLVHGFFGQAGFLWRALAVACVVGSTAALYQFVDRPMERVRRRLLG